MSVRELYNREIAKLECIPEAYRTKLQQKRLLSLYAKKWKS